jgi:flagellar basal body-associated protein FliL
MARDEKKKSANIDIWLILVIVLMVLSIGGGLWLTGQSLLARMDVLSTQTRSQLGRLETETFEVRKQLQTIEFRLRQLGAKEPVANDQPKAAPTEEKK